ncbi:hypothetical protein H5410_036631 [Solanum commersonii]|uniref:Uncharacterized protein n=1 Tax=Solanum commersonii TaxID=4109 RepID=A0A9J5Y669_SOLCO|nr:hypothetical protein H5410_036631 [Solanum commersonii]
MTKPKAAERITLAQEKSKGILIKEDTVTSKGKASKLPTTTGKGKGKSVWSSRESMDTTCKKEQRQPKEQRNEDLKITEPVRRVAKSRHVAEQFCQSVLCPPMIQNMTMLKDRARQ